MGLMKIEKKSKSWSWPKIFKYKGTLNGTNVLG